MRLPWITTIFKTWYTTGCGFCDLVEWTARRALVKIYDSLCVDVARQIPDTVLRSNMLGKALFLYDNDP